MRNANASSHAEKKEEGGTENRKSAEPAPKPSAAKPQQKQPLVFTFEEIRYKDVLKNVTEVLQSGQMTAILGLSGAGKTTLLKIIAGRKKKSSGRLLINGKELSSRNIRKHIAYVHQENHLFSQLKVKEMLLYTIRLKLPKEKEPDALADRILTTLGLFHIRNSFIGDPIEEASGISGGERKRLSIALELISTPEILFLDEPTSGLDAYSSEALILHLKKLTDAGMIVAMTIHQPSSEVFRLFDNMIIIRQGEIVYCGSSAELEEYLAALGLQCPAYTNLADHIFRVLERVPSLKRVSKTTPGEVNELEQIRKKSSSLRDMVRETKILVFRNYLCSFRHPRYILAKATQATIIATVTALLMYNIPAKEKHQRETNVHGCFWALCMGMFSAFAYGAVSIVFTDKNIILKEYGSSYYNFLPYFVAKVFADFSITCLYPFISAPIIFTAARIGSVYHVLTCFLLGAVGHALGILVSSIGNTSEISLTILPAIMYPISMLTGGAVDITSIMAGLRNLQYISPTRHAFNIMIKMHYENETEYGARTMSVLNGFITAKQSAAVLGVMYFVLIVPAGVILKKRISMQSRS